jgi:hypothetical protein
VITIESDVNVRSEPGSTTPIIAVLDRGVSGTIVAGPESANGFTFYLATFPPAPAGWINEQKFKVVASP